MARRKQRPDERHFAVLQIPTDATRVEALVSYRRLHAERRLAKQPTTDLDEAYEDIRRALPTTPVDAKRSRKVRKRSDGSRSQVEPPPDSYYRSLAVEVGADEKRVLAAHVRAQGVIRGEPDERTVRRDLDRSLQVLRAHFRRVAEEEREVERERRRERFQRRHGSRLARLAQAREATERLCQEHPWLLRHFQVLGLESSAMVKEAQRAHDSLLEELTEDEVERRREIEHSLAIIQRAFVELSEPPRMPSIGQGAYLRAASFALCMLLGITALSNLDALRARLNDFEPGDRVVLRSDGRFFGTVLRYESEHVFRYGPGTPVKAFKLKLARSDGEAWVSHWFATNALVVQR